MILVDVNLLVYAGWATWKARMDGFLFWRHVSERIITFREDLMPDINTLEADRAKLLEDFLRLGDLRPGSITAVVRRCGKLSCHCAKPNDPGHDPQFRLTRRVTGKSVTERSPTRPRCARRSTKSPSSIDSRNSAKTW